MKYTPALFFLLFINCRQATIIPISKLPTQAKNLVFHSISGSPEKIVQVLPVNGNKIYYLSESNDSLTIYFSNLEGSSFIVDTVLTVRNTLRELGPLILAKSNLAKYGHLELELSTDGRSIMLRIEINGVSYGAGFRTSLKMSYFKKIDSKASWAKLESEYFPNLADPFAYWLASDTTLYIAENTGWVSLYNTRTTTKTSLFRFQIDSSHLPKTFVFCQRDNLLYLNNFSVNLIGEIYADQIYIFSLDNKNLSNWNLLPRFSHFYLIASYAGYDSKRNVFTIPGKYFGGSFPSESILYTFAVEPDKHTLKVDSVLQAKEFHKTFQFLKFANTSYLPTSKSIIPDTTNNSVELLPLDSLLVPDYRTDYSSDQYEYFEYSFNNGASWNIVHPPEPFATTSDVQNPKRRTARIYVFNKNRKIEGYFEKQGELSVIEQMKYEQSGSMVKINLKLKGMNDLPISAKLFVDDSLLGNELRNRLFLPITIQQNLKEQQLTLEGDLSKLSYKFTKGDILSYYVDISNPALHLIEHIPNQDYEDEFLKPYASYIWGIAALLAIYGLLFIFLYTKPLWVLGFYCSKYYPLLDELPGVFGKAIKKINSFFVSGFIVNSNQVINAWMGENAATFVREFSGRKNVSQRKDYCDIPIKQLVSSMEFVQIIPEATAEVFSQIIHADHKSRSILQIIGPGGAGKTSLSIKIANLFSDPALLKIKNLPVSYSFLPILIEEEANDLLSVIIYTIQKLSATKINDEFIYGLLRNKRIIIIIDALSEKSTEFQGRTLETIKTKPVLANVILTSRKNYDFLINESSTLLYPQPLDSRNLMSFTLELLVKKDIKMFNTLQSQINLAQKLSTIIRYEEKEMAITPILINIALNQIDQIAKMSNLDELADPSAHVLDLIPSSIPSLYSEYIKSVGKTIPKDDFLDMVELIAHYCLTENFTPGEVDTDIIKGAFRAAQFNYSFELALDTMDSSGLININRSDTNVTLVSFILDPLCEVMAAFFVANLNSIDRPKWNTQYTKLLTLQERPVEFCQSLLLIHRKYWKVKQWVNPDDLEEVHVLERAIFPGSPA